MLKKIIEYLKIINTFLNIQIAKAQKFNANLSPERKKFYCGLGLMLALFVSVAYPRLALLGTYAHMDEGSYGFIAALWHDSFQNGNPRPTLYGLSVYPLLLCWLYELPGMPMFWFRLCDFGIALIAGWLFFKILQRESGNSVIGILLGFFFLCGMNAPPVIDSGFKNSYAIAQIFLFLAFLLSYSAAKYSGKIFYAIGASVAASILLRETLLLFALLGFVSIWIGWGKAAAARYAAGGIIFAIIAAYIMHLIALEAGGLPSFFEGYMSREQLYNYENYRIWLNFCRWGREALKLFRPQIFLFAGACAVFISLRKEKKSTRKRALFWLCAALLPFVEPLTKIGFVYHFAVCLPGAAGFCALAWRRCMGAKIVKINNRFLKVSAAIGIILCFLVLRPMPGPATLAMTVDLIENYPKKTWPEKYISRSMPLMALSALDEVSKPGGSLAQSCMAFFLYYISGRMPPLTGWFDPQDQYHLSDLSRTFALLGKDVDRMANALKNNPPEVIAIGLPTGSHEMDYHEDLARAIEKTGLYTRYKVFEPDFKFNYGWFGYELYYKNN